MYVCARLLCLATSSCWNNNAEEPVTESIAKNEKPFVIPELRQWQGAEGMAIINAKSKVLYTDASLQQAAEAMAEDYGLMFGKALKTKSSSNAKAEGIVITLTNDEELGDEGYSIEIGNNVVIAANTPTGAYWDSTRAHRSPRVASATGPTMPCVDL